MSWRRSSLTLTLLLTLALLLWATTAQAQMTCSSANFSAAAIDSSTASTTKTVVIPTDVPANATLVAGVLNRTNETATLVAVSDPVNGSWSLTGTVTGPEDDAGGTSRTWLIHRLASAALTGGANRTLTIETSAGVSTQLVAGWCDDSGGALSFDEGAAVHNDAANDTNHDTSTITLDAAGGLVGFVTSNNTVTSYTADGANESWITATGAGVRVAFVFEVAASGGALGFELTSNPTLSNRVLIQGFLSPSAGGGACTGGLLLLGAGKCDE